MNKLHYINKPKLSIQLSASESSAKSQTESGMPLLDSDVTNLSSNITNKWLPTSPFRAAYSFEQLANNFADLL